MLCSSEASGRGEPTPCKSEWMAQLKLWLWFDDLVDHFEVLTVYMEEGGCLPVCGAFYILFQLSFFCIHFLIGNLQGGQRKL